MKFFSKQLILLLVATSITVMAQDYFLFVGTYTQAKPDKGIYIYGFNSKDGSLKLINTGENIINPSYLAIHPKGKFIYACTETQMNDNGNVSAFAFSKKTGALKLLNKVSSGGDNPCYVAIHKSGKWLVNANYSGGSAAASGIAKDGSLKAPVKILTFTGSSIVKNRQEKSHIHASIFSPDHDFLFLPDLGSDKIWSYAFNASLENPLVDSSSPETVLTPGSGPRHIDFHPNKKFAYCIEELSGMVSAYRYNSGKLESIQRISAHEDSVPEPYGSADIHVSPDGKFLYCSNRANENTIAIFSIADDGMLKRVGVQSTMGNHPRNFIIDPTGNYLLVANMRSDNIIVFKRDANTGLLTPTDVIVSVSRPACLKMIKK